MKTTIEKKYSISDLTEDEYKLLKKGLKIMQVFNCDGVDDSTRAKGLLNRLEMQYATEVLREGNRDSIFEHKVKAGVKLEDVVYDKEVLDRLSRCSPDNSLVGFCYCDKKFKNGVI